MIFEIGLRNSKFYGRGSHNGRGSQIEGFSLTKFQSNFFEPCQIQYLGQIDFREKKSSYFMESKIPTNLYAKTEISISYPPYFGRKNFDRKPTSGIW